MPQPPQKLLEDIRLECEDILAFTRGRSLQEFAEDRMMRKAVERSFEVIGEALRRLTNAHPEVAGRISDHPHIIAFRNVLAHHYDAVAHEIVWDIVQREVAPLRDEVADLLAEFDAAD